LDALLLLEASICSDGREVAVAQQLVQSLSTLWGLDENDDLGTCVDTHEIAGSKILMR